MSAVARLLSALLLQGAAHAFVPPADWAPLDAAVRAQIAAEQVPGAVVVVGDADGIWLRRAWGDRALAPRRARMSPDTIFDLASLTKPVCTTTAVLQLAERGALALDAPVAALWPAFGANGKQAITVRQLLAHTSGLRAGFQWAPQETGADAGRKLLAERPLHPPGSAHLYSDLNFIALGMLVARVAGQPLDRYCRRHVFVPLGMVDTGFRPSMLQRWRIAPTEKVDGQWLRGVPHDPSARRMGGVAGHAGPFGTADDLARFAQALLRDRPAGPLASQSVAALQQPQGGAGRAMAQGLGWSLEAPLAASRELALPLGAVGHTGYTGTGLWIDFVQRRFVVVLASRLHGGAGDARPLRRQVLALVSSLTPPLPLPQDRSVDTTQARAPVVLTGIDVLREQGYAPLRGRRVGLITHLAAVDAHGWRTLDRLRHAPEVTLVRAFTPEHGLYGDLEGRIPSGVEHFSGVPLESLYGATLRPTPPMLEGIDTLVFDLQDAGARFFTYISTLGEAMEAAAEHGLRLVVLDRPNPVGADRIAGPMVDAGLQSFTAFAPMPVQHGMTIGEMARFLQQRLRERRGLDVDLQVIAMQGYLRPMRFSETRLDWVPPSPNLRRPVTALLYPGAAWVEGSNVSVGRGTDHPFEWIGAPWMDGPQLAQALQAMGVPGLEVRPVVFEPAAAPFRGRICEGVELRVTDPARFDATLLGAALVASLHRLWPGTFQIDRTLGMVGSASTLQALRQGMDLQELQARWAAEHADFVMRRSVALLYAQ